MANIKVIGEHSVDINLLTGGIAIDVGCRGFAFSEEMRDLGCSVTAFDLDYFHPPAGILFSHAAVTTQSGMVKYKNTSDPQAKYLSSKGDKEAVAIGLNDIYLNLHENKIDVLKLDCEGTEYHLLSDPNFQPIPRQITVEFHEHAHKNLHDQYFKACMENLLKHYVPVQHIRDSRHGAGMNYWDSLFIRKDLI